MASPYAPGGHLYPYGGGGHSPNPPAPNYVYPPGPPPPPPPPPSGSAWGAPSYGAPSSSPVPPSHNPQPYYPSPPTAPPYANTAPYSSAPPNSSAPGPGYLASIQQQEPLRTWIPSKRVLVEVGNDGLNVRYRGDSGEPEEFKHAAASVKGSTPFRRSGVVYFEMTVLNKGTTGLIAIGAMTKSSWGSNLPGWGTGQNSNAGSSKDKDHSGLKGHGGGGDTWGLGGLDGNSGGGDSWGLKGSDLGLGGSTSSSSKKLKFNDWGYLADDGCVVFGDLSRLECNNGFSIYGTGDVVGCGIDWTSSREKGILFFTKNGQLLGVGTDQIPLDQEIWPAAGIASTGGEIRANFGQEPFRFDIESYRRDPRRAHKGEIGFQKSKALKKAERDELIKVAGEVAGAVGEAIGGAVGS